MVYKYSNGTDKGASFAFGEEELHNLREKNIKWIAELSKNCVKAEYRLQLNEGRYQLMFTPVVCDVGFITY